ncbi:AraC family transcriptional regulator [Photobacterium sp. CCB-ST2H9]|uniref:AraC family transcriptional regulator n=1 Tax=Photobacterium sp. CCB-ST2H9 TaxID=2912855 RepID=UPI002003FC96|nr:AraC family transcriptional regulator [Photobacterium sp. CCB-ST2H9]UTM59439.1 AraC family transcriptional regulator [Photobacterium sp. CCB-ST2H9]
MQYSDSLSQFIHKLAPRVDVFTQIQLNEPWGIADSQRERGSFCYLLAGRCRVEIEEEPALTLQEGQMVLLPYGDAYRVMSEAGVECQSVSEVFDGNRADNVSFGVIGGTGASCELMCGAITFSMIQHWGMDATAVRLPRVMVIDIHHSERMSRYMAWIYQENLQRQSGHQLAMKHLLELMMLEMIRGLPHLDIHPGWLRAINDRYLSPAVLAIQQDYRRDWRLEELAAISALSRSAFAERFKRLTGSTPLQYIRQWRCFIAAQKLAETTQSVQEIAFECGFQSSDVLIRNFKEFHRTTPKQYRMNAQNRQRDFSVSP